MAGQLLVFIDLTATRLGLDFFGLVSFQFILLLGFMSLAKFGKFSDIISWGPISWDASDIQDPSVFLN